MAFIDPVYAVMEVLVPGVGSDAVSGHWIRVIHPGVIRSSYPISPEYRSQGKPVASGQQIATSYKIGRSKVCIFSPSGGTLFTRNSGT
jgi:hypothetical protein